MRRLEMALALLSVVLMHGFAEADQGAGEGEPPRGDAVLRLPFKLHRGFAVVVRGSIGTAKNLNFRLTRALHQALWTAARTQIAIGGFVRAAVDVHPESRRGPGIAADIRLGPFRADELRVLVQDLSVLEETLGVRVDAMVGYDFLKQGPFT